MNLKSIIQAGNPILKQRSIDVPLDKINTAEIQSIIDDLIFTMQQVHGAGLAAPQIGVPLRILCYGFDYNPRYPKASAIPLTVLINPVILSFSEEVTDEFEGCLSISTLRAEVPRYKKIEVKAYDRIGNEIIKKVQDFEAKVVQHEIDHLDGILFVERIKDFTHFGFTAELQKQGVIP